MIAGTSRIALNLAKQVVSDGEGASKLISINCINCKTEKDAKNISFKIANSLLVKSAIAGEDPNSVSYTHLTLPTISSV